MENLASNAVMERPHPTLGIYLRTWLTLVILLLVNIAAAHFRLGSWNLAIALGIAGTQAALILLVFMHVRYSKHELFVVACAGYLWLGILIIGTLHDYLTRNWVPGE